jgi:hypothetical protein
MAGSSPVSRADLVFALSQGLTTEHDMRRFLNRYRNVSTPSIRRTKKIVRRVLRNGAAKQALNTIAQRRAEDKYNPVNWGGKRHITKETRVVNGVTTTRIIPT